MNHIADALVREPRNFSITQAFANAANLLAAARTKFVTSKSDACGELEQVAAVAVRLIRVIDPTYDLAVVRKCDMANDADLSAALQDVATLKEQVKKAHAETAQVRHEAEAAIFKVQAEFAARFPETTAAEGAAEPPPAVKVTRRKKDKDESAE